MRKIATSLPALYAALALSGASALAQQAAPVTLRLAPADSNVMAPPSAVRGFDAPAPALTLQPAAPDALALRGLAPGQDLTDGHVLLDRAPLAAADTDSYFATKEFQDKDQTIERKGHMSAGKQFAGVGEAAAANLALSGLGTLITGK